MDYKALLSDPWVERGLIVLAGLIFLGLLVRLVSKRLVDQIADNETRYRVRKWLQTAAYVVGGMFVLAALARRPEVFSVTLGLASAGVAFALQDVVLSLAAWIAIHWQSIYRPGDRIELMGIRGDVIDINVLQTTLMEIGGWVEADLYNGRIVRIGNNHIFKGPVVNYTVDFPFLWDEIVVPVKFTSDHDRARKIMLDAANDVVGEYTQQSTERWTEVVKKYLIEEASTAPTVAVVANDNYVRFKLRYIVDYRRRRSTTDILTGRILAGILATDGAVELASETLQLVDLPRVEVNMESGAAKA